MVAVVQVSSVVQESLSQVSQGVRTQILVLSMFIVEYAMHWRMLCFLNTAVEVVRRRQGMTAAWHCKGKGHCGGPQKVVSSSSRQG